MWYPLRRKLKPLPWWGFLLFLVPMGIDGVTHMISDFYGIGQGFRYHNAWLAKLTNNSFAPTFYAGDALGSFNSWMRLITGLLFGVGIVWFGFPYLEKVFQETAQTLVTKFGAPSCIRSKALLSSPLTSQKTHRKDLTGFRKV